MKLLHMWLLCGFTCFFVQEIRAQDVTLECHPPEVFENEPVTLVLKTKNQNNNYRSGWTFNGTEFALVTWNNLNCAKVVYTDIPVKYEVFCNSTTVSIKIEQVQRNIHGLIWRGYLLFDQRSTTIFVKVPVEYVNITLQSGEFRKQLKYVENETATLECKSSLSRPQPTNIWFIGKSYSDASVVSSISYNETDGTYSIARSVLSITLNRANNNKWLFCNSSNVPDVTSVSSYYSVLDVQYPPTVGQLENSNIIEGKTFSKPCLIQQGNPAETNITWKRSDTMEIVSNSVNLDIINISRSHKGQYMCFARNRMITSHGSLQEGMASESFDLNVLYRPENFTVNLIMDAGMPFTVTQNFTVIENTYLVFNCSASGNPEPRHFLWSGLMRNYSNVLQFNATRNFTGQVTCHAYNTMEPTNGTTAIGHGGVTYELNILYKPENVAIRMSLGTEQQFNITNNLFIIEHTSVVFYCSASGNPEPKHFSWSIFGIHPIDSERLQLNATRQVAGPITCHANNIMEHSNGTNITGHGSVTYDMNILYPPELRNESAIREAEGRNVTFHCLLLPGQTTNQTVRWTKHGGVVWHGDSFTISNVRILNSGNYTCEVEYFMEPTYGEIRHGLLKHEIYLEVVEQIFPTKTDSNISTVGTAVGGAVGGVVGGLVIAVVFATSIIYYRKRRTTKSPETPVYQNTKTQDGYMSSLNDGFANVYDKLQNTGSNSNQQYQQLSSFVREGNTGQPKVYENLRLTKKSEELNVENSSGQLETVSPNKRIQTIV